MVAVAQWSSGRGDPVLGETFRSPSKFTRGLNPTPSFSPKAETLALPWWSRSQGTRSHATPRRARCYPIQSSGCFVSAHEGRGTHPLVTWGFGSQPICSHPQDRRPSLTGAPYLRWRHLAFEFLVAAFRHLKHHLPQSSVGQCPCERLWPHSLRSCLTQDKERAAGGKAQARANTVSGANAAALTYTCARECSLYLSILSWPTGSSAHHVVHERGFGLRQCFSSDTCVN